jgi:hypothetical protein
LNSHSSTRAAQLLNYQITQLPNENRLPAGILAPDLCFEVTSFAAGTTVVGTVLAQADFIKTLAQYAVFVAGAGSFRLVTDPAYKFFGHNGRLARFGVSGNGPMVDGLAMEIVPGARRSGEKSRGLAMLH